MKVYMDVCCLNRPFDDQSQERIKLESETVLMIFDEGVRMDIGAITPEEIRKEGLKALVGRLDVVGAIGFLQQFEFGEGDYTKDREKFLGDKSVNELVEEIKARRRHKR